MSQLNKWMTGGKISKLVVVITSKETGEHVERWQFDVRDTRSHRYEIEPNKGVDGSDPNLGPDPGKSISERIITKACR
jgi:hypothetical protein